VVSAMKRALEQDDPPVSAKARPNQRESLTIKTQLKIKELSMSSSKKSATFSDHVLVTILEICQAFWVRSYDKIKVVRLNPVRSEAGWSHST